MFLTKTIYAVIINTKKINRSKVVKSSNPGPNATRATPPYDVAPVRREQEHSMYKAKPVVMAEMIMRTVPRTKPVF